MLLQLDGFDHYGTTALASNTYFTGSGYETPTYTVSPSTSYGRNTGSLGMGLSTNTAAQTWLKKRIQPSQYRGVTPYVPVDRCILGFAFRCPLALTGLLQILSFGGQQVSIQSNFVMTVNGVVTPYVIELNIWNYLEIEVDTVDSVVRLFMNDNLVYEAAAATISWEFWEVMARYTTGGTTNVIHLHVDDLYVLDGATTQGAGDINTERLGKVYVLTRYPTSDVEVGFSRSSGASNYLLVDEAAPNGDTDYVFGRAPELTDLYGNTTSFEVVDDNAIVGMGLVPVIRNVEPDGRSVTAVVRSNGVTKEGVPAKNIRSAVYTSEMNIFEYDPATSQRWTAAGVIACAWGHRLKDIPDLSI